MLLALTAMTAILSLGMAPTTARPIIDEPITSHNMTKRSCESDFGNSLNFDFYWGQFWNSESACRWLVMDRAEAAQRMTAAAIRAATLLKPTATTAPLSAFGTRAVWSSRAGWPSTPREPSTMRAATACCSPTRANAAAKTLALTWGVRPAASPSIRASTHTGSSRSVNPASLAVELTVVGSVSAEQLLSS